jgi:hypothetical protein
VAWICTLAAVPTVPAWLPGLVTVTVLPVAAEIVQVNAADPDAPTRSFAVTVTLNAPAAVGVPVISPVEELTYSPAGSPAAV